MIEHERMVRTLANENVDVIVASSEQNVFYTTGLKLVMHTIGFPVYSVWSVEHSGPHLVFPFVDGNQIAESKRQFEGLYSYGDIHYYEGEDLSDVDRAVLGIDDITEKYDEPIDALVAVLDTLVDDGDTVAVEGANLSIDQIDAVMETIDGGPLIEAEGIFSELREIKTDDEIERLRTAARITETSIMEAIEHANEGMTERDLAKRLQTRMIENGASDVLHIVVGFGPHSAHTHTTPYEEYGTGNRTLEPGQIIEIDTGCVYGGYASDLGRTVSFRSAPESAKARYDVVRSTVEKVISLITDGADTAEITKAGQTFMREAGVSAGIEQFDEYVGHEYFGHGVGADVYDQPLISLKSTELRAGMVLNVEAPYQELGTADFQCEDTVLVTDDGVDRFTRAPRELPIIG